MSIVDGYRFEQMIDDPDDHRPGSAIALLVDPGDANGRVDDLAVIAERIGPGDRIPLHIHRVDEVILPAGPGLFRLGPTERRVDDGSVVFIPAGAAHGLHNDGSEPLPIRAIFPTTRVWIRTLDRNPAPGTELDRPLPGVTYDFRTGELEVDPG